MVGSALQHTCPDGKEKTGEVVEDHEVGTRTRDGPLVPKEG
jgi:hypothetical protein